MNIKMTHNKTFTQMGFAVVLGFVGLMESCETMSQAPINRTPSHLNAFNGEGSVGADSGPWSALGVAGGAPRSLPTAQCRRGPSSDALQAMKSCENRSTGCDLKTVVDATQSPPGFYVIQNGRTVLCSTAALGRGGAQGKYGHRKGSKMTPAGIHYTKVHNGARYQSHNSVGLSGKRGSPNQSAVNRGILIHAENRASTWGCVGIPQKTFNKYHRMTRRGDRSCPVYIHFGNHGCGGERGRGRLARNTGSEERSPAGLRSGGQR